MLDIVTYLMAKGARGGDVTLQQLEEAFAAKQNLLVAGTGKR